MVWARRWSIAVWVCALLVTVAFPPLTSASAFADSAFQAQWQQGEALNPNFWGPLANAQVGQREPYKDAQGGQRLVQYFDKGRMELTGGKLTNGLLASDMLDGRIQIGDSTFDSRPPPAISIAGDPDGPGVTYAILAGKASSLLAPAPRRGRADVTATVSAAGDISTGARLADTTLVGISAYDGPTQHNVPQSFDDYRTKVGLLTVGYAFSEPFVTTIWLGGETVRVLVQVFERRTLTSAEPGSRFNPAGLVEMGNVGQHYYRWRYALPGAPVTPAVASSTTPTVTPVAGGVGMCDGVADDTAAIQAALDMGGTVTINSGTCVITGALHYPSNTTLVGAGQDVTTIKNRTGRNGAIMLQPGGDRVAHFTVKNLTLDAASTSNANNVFTVSAKATSYFTSDHVTYRHVMQMAVWTDGAGATATDHLVIQNSRVTEAFGDGFSFFGQITDSSIANNEVTGCMDDGIAFQENVDAWGPQGYPTRIAITGNNVHDCTQRNSFGSTANGINIFGSDNVTVSNNTVRNVVSDGLRFTGGVNRRATNIYAYGNTVVNPGANYQPGSGVPAWAIHIDRSDNVEGRNNMLTAGSTGDVYRKIRSTNVTGFPWPST